MHTIDEVAHVVASENEIETAILKPANWPSENSRQLKEAVAMKLVWSDCRAWTAPVSNLMQILFSLNTTKAVALKTLNTLVNMS